MRKPNLEEKNTLTVEEAIKVFGLSRRKFWRLMDGMEINPVAFQNPKRNFSHI